MNTKETIIDKIRKLMAMADKASGATENEMATAMAMAQNLMMRHAIELDELRGPEEPGVIEKQTSELFRPWASNLAAAAAMLNMAHSLQSKVGGRLRFYFIGRPEAVEASEILLTQLIKETNRLFKQDMGIKHGLGLRARGVYRENFKFGVSVRIWQRAHRMMEELRNDNLKAIERTGSTALVVSSTIDQRLGEINDWIAETYPKLKESKKSRKQNFLGFGRGHEAGANAKIREELN